MRSRVFQLARIVALHKTNCMSGWAKVKTFLVHCVKAMAIGKNTLYISYVEFVEVTTRVKILPEMPHRGRLCSSGLLLLGPERA